MYALAYAGSSIQRLVLWVERIHTLKEELVCAGVLSEDFNLNEHIEFAGMQAGDVTTTFADSSPLERDFGFTPKIGIREGLRAFAKWYRDYSSKNRA